MKLAGERSIEAPPEKVWAALNDEALLLKCIPGCKALERISDDELAARVDAKVGPVKASFKGQVRLENVSPPHSYTLVGQGKGAAGFAKGRADVALQGDGGATRLAYSVEATVGGKLAQMGARLVDSTARKYADGFFDCFARVVTEGAGTAEAKEPAAGDLKAPPGREPGAAETVPHAPGSPTPPPEAAGAGKAPPAAEPRGGLPAALWAALLIGAVLALLYLFAG